MIEFDYYRDRIDSKLLETTDLNRFLPKVDLERRLLFLEGAKRSPIPAMVMVTFLAYQLAPSVGQLSAWLWAGLLCVVFILRLIGVSWVLKQPGDYANQRAVSLFMTGTGLAVGGLALFAILAWFPGLSIAHRSLMTMVYVGWIAGGMAAQGCYPQWTPYWTVPIVLGCVIAWARQADTYAWGIALLIVIVFILMTAGLLSSAKSIKESILAKLENRELARELLAQRSLVENAARAKTSFLIAASHDLRQPAMGLGLLISAIQAAPDLNSARKIAVGAERALGAMERILQALLEFSRLDTGQVKVNRSPFNLREMLQSLVDETRHSVQPGVTVTLEVGNISIISDPALLEQIVRNFLSNAARFTETGSIVVTATTVGQELIIAVRDTGIGIAQESQESIFKEYFQIGTTSGSRSKGLGLGLSIVDKAARLLSATVSVESGLAQGSTFTIALPIEFQSSKPQEAPIGNIADLPAKFRLSNKTVLIVDDDALVRESFQMVLETFGAKVLVCANPDVTFQVLKDVRGRVDVAFVDYQISEAYHGIDLIEAMHSQWPGIRSVLITGDVRKEVGQRAKEAAIQVMYKPLRVQKLIEILEEKV
jgi:two-component system, sensor histidine kinase